MSNDASSFSACNAAKADWNNLTHDDIIRLNTYDFMAYLGKRVINPGGIRGRDQILSALKPAPGSRVLEIGGGSGHAACHIARNYQCHVTTLDISPRSIREARELVSREGLSDAVTCTVGDVLNLHFSEETFDYVICQAVVMFVDQSRALSEMRRVLKTGGKFSGLEFCWKKAPPPTVRQKTYAVCGCTTLDFHNFDGWLQKIQGTGFSAVKAAEHPFGLLSPRGFLRDEGLVNSMRIGGRVLRRRVAMLRMSEIWSHFSRNREYFSYVVFAADK